MTTKDCGAAGRLQGKAGQEAETSSRFQAKPQTEPHREPWMRGTHGELDPVRRAVLHALDLTEEDAARWCATLDDAAMFARPAGLPAVAFHLRHMAKSLDRLLTYAEGRSLDHAQLAALANETAGAGRQVRRESKQARRQR